MKDHCEAQGRSVSGFVEEAVAEKLEALGIPRPTVLRPRVKKDDRVKYDPIPVSQHFTF